MTIGITHFRTLRPQKGLGFKPNGVPNGTPIISFSMILIWGANGLWAWVYYCVLKKINRSYFDPLILKDKKNQLYDLDVI
jgi:hypothetical protein